MSKKKKQATSAGTYALCITVGIILGIGLTPLAGNFIVMVILGAAGGALVGFLINRNRPSKTHRKHP